MNESPLKTGEVIDLAAMGRARTAAEVLNASSDDVISEWRASCTAAALGDRLADAGPGAVAANSDELTADRAQAMVSASGRVVVAALIALLESDEQVPHDLSYLTEAAAAISGDGLPMGAVVRQFSLLRKVLHDHARRHVPAGAVAEAEHQLDLALDTLVEACVARAAERLEEDAFVDPLTGLLNRRALERDLGREMAVAERHGRLLSLLTLDVDRLKQINDLQGHAMGDEALRSLASAIRRALRAGDSAYRVGGDEFVVLLPEMGPEVVSGFVSRVRANAPPAFSWGAATFPSDATACSSLLDLADQRLLAYRRAGGTERVPMTADRITNPAVTPAVPAEPGRSRNPAVLAAFVGGLLLGGGSLASAATGTLPRPMQQAAHSVLEKIGVLVPSGKAEHVVGTPPADRSVERFLGDAGTPCTLPDGSQFSGTHGQYVAAHPDDPDTPEDERAAAAQSRCGRPVAGGPTQPPAAPGNPGDPGAGAEPGRPDGAGAPEDPGRQGAGPPATAVKPPTTPVSAGGAVPPTAQQRPAPGPTTTTTTTVAPASSPLPAAPVAEEPPPPGRGVGRQGAQEAPAPSPTQAEDGETRADPNERSGGTGKAATA